MRLTDEEVEAICRLFREHFGLKAHLWLFGSRVDDTKRGGDIDLYVETQETNVKVLVKKKINYLIALEREIGERHVDLVLRTTPKELPIYRIARDTGIQLV